LARVYQRLVDTVRSMAPYHWEEFCRFTESGRLEINNNFLDLNSLWPDVWLAAHPEHVLSYRRDEAEAAAVLAAARKPRRRAGSPEARPRTVSDSLPRGNPLGQVATPGPRDTAAAGRRPT
jgi:hypothetical protein